MRGRLKLTESLNHSIDSLTDSLAESRVTPSLTRRGVLQGDLGALPLDEVGDEQP
jgi:hypothetical protein